MERVRAREGDKVDPSEMEITVSHMQPVAILKAVF